MKKAITRTTRRTSTRPDPREKLIAELEAIVRDHRAGRDVLNRLAHGEDNAGKGLVRLTCALTVALRGPKALSRYPHQNSKKWNIDCEGVDCNSEELAKLVAFGEGNAEAGAQALVHVAIEWLENDRPGFKEWARKGLARLSPKRLPGGLDDGFFDVERWCIPVAGDWFAPLSDASEEIAAAAPTLNRQFGQGGITPWGILRAMITDIARGACRPTARARA